MENDRKKLIWDQARLRFEEEVESYKMWRIKFGVTLLLVLSLFSLFKDEFMGVVGGGFFMGISFLVLLVLGLFVPLVYFLYVMRGSTLPASGYSPELLMKEKVENLSDEKFFKSLMDRYSEKIGVLNHFNEKTAKKFTFVLWGCFIIISLLVVLSLYNIIMLTI